MSTSPDGEPVVIAIGNRWRGDDAAGPLVADRLNTGALGCRIVEGRMDALGLINAWDGAPLAIIIDAANTGAAPGTVHYLDGADAVRRRGIGRCSSHGSGLAEALALGEVLQRVPSRLRVFAIELGGVRDGAPPTPAVAAAITTVAHQVTDALQERACTKPH